MVGVSRVGGDRGNMNDSEYECSVCNIFWEWGTARVPSAGIFLSTKIVDRRKKWDTDNWDCNKTVLLSVAVDAVVTI